METLKFTVESIAGLIVEGVFMMLIPAALFIIWKVKTHEKVLPVLIGAATWFVFAILLKTAPAYFLLQADSPLAKTISGNVWLTYLVAGVLAGVFEETGRFIAYKLILKKYKNRRASISYGIGHGGFESVYIGFQMISLAVIGILFNAGLGGLITGNADEASLALINSQLQPYTNLNFFTCLLGVFERLTAIAAHISFSVLVFAAARNKKRLHLYPISVLLHALFDFIIVFYAAEFIPVWAMELVLAAFAALMAFLAYRIYKKLKADEKPADAEDVQVKNDEP